MPARPHPCLQTSRERRSTLIVTILRAIPSKTQAILDSLAERHRSTLPDRPEAPRRPL